MAVDIGAEALDRVTYMPFGYTMVSKTNPASINGTIASIEIFAKESIAGLIIGTFYLTGENRLKCRASEVIPGTLIAKVTKPVSILVEVGDYIGYYSSSGELEVGQNGEPGVWYKEGESISPGDEEIYIFTDNRIASLGGYIPVVGWTGKISGVTNPAKIMGVDVANIAKVKGVVSA